MQICNISALMEMRFHNSEMLPVNAIPVSRGNLCEMKMFEEKYELIHGAFVPPQNLRFEMYFVLLVS